MIVKYNLVIAEKNFVMVWGQAPGGYLGPLSEGAVCPMGRLREARPHRFLRIEFVRIGACRRPYTQKR